MNNVPWRKWLLVFAGISSLALGLIGIFVPLLPTTPFLLLAAFCFARSSERLHQWLINHRLFGSYIRNYQEYRAITKQVKIVTLILLWGTIGYAIVAVLNLWYLRILLLLVAVGVTVHVLLLKTLTQEMDLDSADDQDEGSDEG
jgi:hypothetical protein